jgi:hypothetical protein
MFVIKNTSMIKNINLKTHGQFPEESDGSHTLELLANKKKGP